MRHECLQPLNPSESPFTRLTGEVELDQLQRSVHNVCSMVTGATARHKLESALMADEDSEDLSEIGQVRFSLGLASTPWSSFFFYLR